MQKVRDSYGQEQKRGRGNPNYGIAKPYNEVREIIKPYKFRSVTDYRAWALELKRMGAGEGLPLNPYAVYTRKGEWVSRKHFLGMTDDEPVVLEENKPVGKSEQVSFSKIRTIISQILGLKREKLAI